MIGTCSSTGACTCNPGFTGATCSQCLSGYYGPNCLPCPGTLLFPFVFCVCVLSLPSMIAFYLQTRAHCVCMFRAFIFLCDCLMCLNCLCACVGFPTVCSGNGVCSQGISGTGTCACVGRT